MANQESGARRGIFGIGAPPRERTITPVLPKPPEVRPAPVPPEPGRTPEPPTRKSLHERLARVLKSKLVRLGLATGVIGIGGVGVYEAYQNIPAVHQQVDNLTGTDTVPSVPSTFDNNKDKGVIGEQNISTVAPEEIKNLPSFNENAQPLLLFPINNMQPGQTINYEKNMSVAGWSKETLDMAAKEGIKDYVVLPSVPIGTEFIAPIGGRAFVMTRPIDGEITPIGVTIEFMSPDNILYFINIGLGVAPIIPYRAVAEKAIDVLVQAPYKGPENSNGREWEKGLLVERGILLFRTTEQKDVDISIQGGINGKLENPRIPGNVTFLTNPTASQKLLVSK